MEYWCSSRLSISICVSGLNIIAFALGIGWISLTVLFNGTDVQVRNEKRWLMKFITTYRNLTKSCKNNQEMKGVRSVENLSCVIIHIEII